MQEVRSLPYSITISKPGAGGGPRGTGGRHTWCHVSDTKWFYMRVGPGVTNPTGRPNILHHEWFGLETFSAIEDRLVA